MEKPTIISAKHCDYCHTLKPEEDFIKNGKSLKMCVKCREKNNSWNKPTINNKDYHRKYRQNMTEEQKKRKSIQTAESKIRCKERKEKLKL
jgi:hypothetical protein